MRMNQIVVFSKIFVSSIALVVCTNTVQGEDTVQGWTAEEREAMYYGTQGSRLIPRTWFDALETADRVPFADMDHLTSFGLLPPPNNAPSTYPIGIAVDQQADRHLSFSKLRWYKGQGGRANAAEPWVGLNCAACHTGSYVVEDELAIVDGAPSMFDYQKFVNALDKSMEDTLPENDQARWDRFAGRVLSGKISQENKSLLESAFTSLLEWQKKTDAMNENETYYTSNLDASKYDDRVLEYGYGRVDAIGHILNKVIMFTGGGELDGNPANAPVSYPFLWNIWKQHNVQWNGSVQNNRIKVGGGSIEYGALGRNSGEVIGVFGDIIIRPKSSGYKSSVNVSNLDRMEHILKRLKPPKWPSAFPPIQTDLAETGRKLFRKNCARCHLTPDMQKVGEPTEKMLAFVDTPDKDITDIWMACNAFVYEGPTGLIKGAKDLEGNVLDDTAPVFNMLGTAVRGALREKWPSIAKEAALTIFGFERLPEINRAPGIFDPRAGEREDCLTTEGVAILSYKARPLDGIWATAPYLHNGSVASLYQLLLPANERKKVFWVGNRNFDTDEVGYVDAMPENGQVTKLRAREEDGTIIEGNGNQGHEYGASDLTDEDRKALVEYMKSL